MTFTMTTTINGKRFRVENLESVEAASAAFCAKRDATGAGASACGKTTVTRGGEPVATISYNGQIRPV